jgi:nitrogenase molybdenum-cofactor synthesis protein NifE
MITNIEKLTEHGCVNEKKDKVCRSRGGESCAFDGAMIVLQPIADAAHIVHGPIACCGNSWEGRGSLSKVGARHAVPLHKMGFTTDMSEMDIVYGSEEKLYKAVLDTCEAVKPKAVFVYATCVSGLIGEDMEDVCKRAERESGVRVIPVNAPGFVGPKNLGNRIAGEVLLDHVIGTGEPNFTSSCDINLIGEYNIAGDLWLVEPVLRDAGIRVLSRITGDSTFGEITYAHRAKLNVVVCSRALINIAKEMERRYGIPYIEVSFFGKTEMSKALRAIAAKSIEQGVLGQEVIKSVEAVILRQEERLFDRLKAYEHLKGKKAVLYTGGVKSWSFISALRDLGIEIKAVGTKKSSIEDEEKMREIMGEDAPLIEDTTPKNLLRLLKENNADILVAGGRNQYLAIKEGYPFVDVNQERHIAYAGYEGLINLAEQISSGARFYEGKLGIGGWGLGISKKTNPQTLTTSPILVNPLKHSQSIGAAIAFQGIDNALPIIHGAQGCTFLGKVLLTKHFREPIALAGTKLFTEEVVMGSDEKLIRTAKGFIEKNRPEVIGVLTSGLSEVKGDDTQSAIKQIRNEYPGCRVLYVSTPDYEGGLETGYARAVEELTGLAEKGGRIERQVNVLAGSHLTPADFTELREIIESFGLKPVILPDLSALDGSRQGVSALARGGTSIDEIAAMGKSEFTIAIGASMEQPALSLKERSGVEYRMFEGLTGLHDTDMFMETLSMLSGKPLPSRYERQRRILVDGMRDAHFYFGNKRVCLALEPDLALQTSRWIAEMGAHVGLAVIPHYRAGLERICAETVVVNDLFSVEGEFDVLISNSHAENAAKKLNVPLYQTGFPAYKVLGGNSRNTIGYRGTLMSINDVANLLKVKEVHQ